jgi:hypothetical protein
MYVKLLVWLKSLRIILISAVSSSNTYTKTFTGIDGAGKRLADEVSHEICRFVCPMFGHPILVLIVLSFI